RRVERFLFWSNYKGSTDFMTRYVYPPFVWVMVRPLARLRVHPNWVTAVDILATFAAVPFFMAGAWVPGLALAYLMSVLDSVDGKLARVTFTSSKLGEVLDHGLDIVHPPVWYLAWGWALGGASTSSLPWRHRRSAVQDGGHGRPQLRLDRSDVDARRAVPPRGGTMLGPGRRGAGRSMGCARTV
ncbi:MAG: CDP-alcohol phosphatidyltransferase family protein, partial [Acidimicrobiales bacterium]|nr:CDP-alcohol phosphatidyltransferase family protein [Acidimicrobiales bacterium]